MLSGRAARRAQMRGMRRRGPGWTRPFRKGRDAHPDGAYQRPRVRVPYPAREPNADERATMLEAYNAEVEEGIRRLESNQERDPAEGGAA